MSWSETLLDASYRGVPLGVMAESMEGERELAQHGVPYRDGDDVEDLGRKARPFSFTVVVFGTNYEIELQKLLAALDTRGPGELIHPIYGRLDVVARKWKVDHTAERPDYAQVEIQFVERTPYEPFFARQFEFVDEGMLSAEDGRRWQDGLLDLLGQVDALVAAVQQLIGGGWIGLLENLLGLPGIGLRLLQLRSQILGIVSGLASLVGKNAGAQFDPLLDLRRTPTEIRAAISAQIDPSATDAVSSNTFAISSSAQDADAVEISNEQYTELLSQMEAGKRIVPGEDGFPYAADQLKPTEEQSEERERAWRDAQLQQYGGIRDRHRDELELGIATTLTAEQYADLLTLLQALRDWPQSEAFPNATSRPGVPESLSTVVG